MSKMIGDLEGYFRGLVPKRDALLQALEREAREEDIRIIGPLVGALLEVLVWATGARRVLELGTATGYSAIYLARACLRNGGRLWTVERDPGMAERARANLRRAGVDGAAEVLNADAGQAMEGLTPPLDLIFLDIDKEFYLPALSGCGRLLRSGGLLLVDNVGFRQAEPFNQKITSHPDWLAVPLLAFLPGHSPEQDGLMIALRR